MIYATEYDAATLQPTSVSRDSGFTSLDEVRAVMGPPDKYYKAMLFYNDWVFSRVPFLIDDTGNSK